MIFKFFFIALNSKTDWTLQNIPTEIVNKNMERFNLQVQPPGCDQIAQLSQKQKDQPTHTNLTHIYASKIRAQNILTVNTVF